MRANRPHGAVYLAGYAVELALKARICATLNWSGFPSTAGEFQGYQTFRTHDLDILLHLSGIEPAIKARYLTEWSVVATWDPNTRGDREVCGLVARGLQKVVSFFHAFVTLVIRCCPVPSFPSFSDSRLQPWSHGRTMSNWAWGHARFPAGRESCVRDLAQPGPAKCSRRICFGSPGCNGR